MEGLLTSESLVARCLLDLWEVRFFNFGRYGALRYPGFGHPPLPSHVCTSDWFGRSHGFACLEL